MKNTSGMTRNVDSCEKNNTIPTFGKKNRTLVESDLTGWNTLIIHMGVSLQMFTLGQREINQ